MQIDPITSKADKASHLITSLDYHQFQEGPIDQPIPLFTLEHSFCGYNTEANEHTAGCGFLTIAFPIFPGSGAVEALTDHRVYTSNQLTSVMRSER